MKYAAAVLFAISFILLAACSGGEPLRTEEPTIIHFPIFVMDEFTDQFDYDQGVWTYEVIYKDAIENFNKLDNGIHVVPVEIDRMKHSVYGSQLGLMMGEEADKLDIIRIHEDFYSYDLLELEEPLLADLSHWISVTETDIPLAIIDWGVVNGRQQVLPAYLNPASVAINDSIFKRTGIEYPEDAITWEKLWPIIQEINDRPDNFKGFDLFLPSTLSMLLKEQGMSFLSPDGKRASGYLDSPTAVQAVEWMNKIYNFDIETILNTWGTFAPGNVAIRLSRMNDSLAETNPDTEIGYRRFPHFEGKERKVPTTYGGFAINEKSDNKNAAWEFIKYFAIDINEDSVRLSATHFSSSPSLVQEALSRYEPLKLRLYAEDSRYVVHDRRITAPSFYWTDLMLAQLQEAVKAPPDEIHGLLQKLALEIDEQLQMTE